MGFSVTTAQPASSAATMYSSWVLSTVHTTTASTRSRRNIAPNSAAG